MGNNCYKNKESDLRDQETSDSNGTNKAKEGQKAKGGKQIQKSTNG